SPLLERLEVVLHLGAVVERDVLLGQRVFHHLPVLRVHPHVRQARGVLGPATDHVGVVRLLPSLARLPLHAHVDRVLAQAVAGVAAPVRVAALAGHRGLAPAEVRVAVAPAPAAPAAAPPAPAGAAPAVAPRAPAIPAALQPLAAALGVFHRPHLVERALHGAQAPPHLPLLEGLRAFHQLLAEVPLAPRLPPPAHAVHL